MIAKHDAVKLPQIIIRQFLLTADFLCRIH